MLLWNLFNKKPVPSSMNRVRWNSMKSAGCVYFIFFYTESVSEGLSNRVDNVIKFAMDFSVMSLILKFSGQFQDTSSKRLKKIWKKKKSGILWTMNKDLRWYKKKYLQNASEFSDKLYICFGYLRICGWWKTQWVPIDITESI